MYTICSLCILSKCRSASNGREGGHFWVFTAAASSCTEVICSCSLMQQVVGSTISHSLWQISKTPISGTTTPKHQPTSFHSSACPVFAMLTDFCAFSSCCTNKTILSLSYLTINLLPFPPSFTHTQISSKLFKQGTLLYFYFQIFWQLFTLCHIYSLPSPFLQPRRRQKKGVKNYRKEKVSLKWEILEKELIEWLKKCHCGFENQKVKRGENIDNFFLLQLWWENYEFDLVKIRFLKFSATKKKCAKWEL